MSPAAREPLPDALRALALLGVLAVNAGGYATAPWGPLLGVPQPAGDPLARAVLGVQAALLQGKAYPVLACLFGMGLALATRGRTADAERCAYARLQKLLLLGVAHGTLLYFGDILTLYAVCGLIVLPHVHEPMRRLRRRVRRALGWALGMALVGLAATAALSGMPVQTTPPEQTLAGAPGYAALLPLNVTAFIGNTLFGLVLLLPVLRLCMLCGVMAARLRWLTHARWQVARSRLVRRGLPLMLAVNLVYGWGVAQLAGVDDQRAWWIDSLSPLVGLPLTICLVAAAAQAWNRGHRQWLLWLASLGRRTLSVYLGHALWCLLLFSGAGLAWRPGTLGIFALSLALWATVALLARVWPGRWPLEAWMGRRS